MADQDTKRVSKAPSSAAPPAPEPSQTSGEPDNENQYGGGRQVDMPREQNRDTPPPPTPTRQKAPDNNGRVRNSSGPGTDAPPDVPPRGRHRGRAGLPH